MRVWCSVSLVLIFTTVSVHGDCLVLKCADGSPSVNDNCRSRRSLDYDNCNGNKKVYINDSVFNDPGYVSIRCDDGFVFDEYMDCQYERWEAGSGPWRTQHAIVRGRNVVLEIRRSDVSVKLRHLRIQPR